MDEQLSGTYPLILTLALDAATQIHFDALRREHFPPARNFLDAHLTLFHALPGDRQDFVEDVLDRATVDQAPLTLQVSGLRSLGSGTAYVIEGAALMALRARLARFFDADLGAQDRQPFRPHITVQNKVRPELANALLDALRSGFTPWSAQGTGLRLWHYEGGPWRAAATFPFGG